MRFHIGQSLEHEGAHPDPRLWTPLASPSSARAFPLAAITGIAVLLVLLSLILYSTIPAAPATPDPTRGQRAPWQVALATLVLSLPAHEAIHAAFYPGGLFSRRLTFLLNPKRLTLAVYYEGRISKRRWMVARLAPFLVLAVIPTLLLLTAPPPLGIAIETMLAILLLVNALGSGGDLLSAGWVLLRVPRGSTLGFYGGKAYLELANLTPA